GGAAAGTKPGPAAAARGGHRAACVARLAAACQRPAHPRLGLHQQPVAVHLLPDPRPGGCAGSQRRDPRPAPGGVARRARQLGAKLLRGADGTRASLPRPHLLVGSPGRRPASPTLVTTAAQPLTAPSVSPFTRYRCSATVMTMLGSMTITA